MSVSLSGRAETKACTYESEVPGTVCVPIRRQQASKRKLSSALSLSLSILSHLHRFRPLRPLRTPSLTPGPRDLHPILRTPCSASCVLCPGWYSVLYQRRKDQKDKLTPVTTRNPCVWLPPCGVARGCPSSAPALQLSRPLHPSRSRAGSVSRSGGRSVGRSGQASGQPDVRQSKVPTVQYGPGLRSASWRGTTELDACIMRHGREARGEDENENENENETRSDGTRRNDARRGGRGCR